MPRGVGGGGSFKEVRKRSMLGMSLGIGMRLINQVTVLPRQDTSESAYRIDGGRAAGK